MTYSRGGLLALLAALAATTLLGGPRLRGLLAFALAALAAVLPLAFAFSRPALTHDNVPVSDRVGPGLELALRDRRLPLALPYLGRRLIATEAHVPRIPTAPPGSARPAPGGARRARPPPPAARLPARPDRPISHEVDAFTQAKAVPVTDPSRLLSTNSGNRWVWWKEAAGAFADQPIGGWGAGSFPVTHLLYRQPPALDVQQPHNVPLQFLAEDGLFGALLALGAIGPLIAAGLTRVRSLPEGRERAWPAPASPAGWPGPSTASSTGTGTSPGRRSRRCCCSGSPRGRCRVRAPAARAPQPPTLRPPIGALALAVVTLASRRLAASAILPDLSRSKARRAGPGRARQHPRPLPARRRTADLAARLNPLAVDRCSTRR